jgi:hypothetical protein
MNTRIAKAQMGQVDQPKSPAPLDQQHARVTQLSPHAENRSSHPLHPYHTIAQSGASTQKMAQLKNIANRPKTQVVQRMRIIDRNHNGNWSVAEENERGAEETNNMGFPDFMDMLRQLIQASNYRLINDILMDMPLDRLQIFNTSIARAHGNDHAQEYELIRMFYSNRRPSQVTVNLTPNAQEMLRQPERQPDLSRLTEVEDWHEDALGNMRQGMTETSMNKRLTKPEISTLNLGDDMRNFLGQEVTLDMRLRAIRDTILNGTWLVRRISEVESDIFSMSDFAMDPANVFLKGKESMKAFIVDGEYSFKDKTRDKDENAYAVILKIRLTEKLKQYFIEFLFANVSELLGSRFAFNPQFKFEQGGITILIPKAGWETFMTLVGNNYEILTQGSKENQSSGSSHHSGNSGSPSLGGSSQQLSGSSLNPSGQSQVPTSHPPLHRILPFTEGMYDLPKIIEVHTWEEAARLSFRRGQAIRILHNEPDNIRDVIFIFHDDYNPSGLQPQIPGDILTKHRLY